MNMASGFAICHQPLVDPVGGEQVVPRLPLGLLVSIDTQVSVTTQSAPRRRLRIARSTLTLPPSRRAQSIRPGARLQPLGAGQPQFEAEARRGVNPACRDVVAVAAPGDDAAGDRPRCSSKVITSAMIWQGCDRSVRPLITGTVA